MLFKRLASFSSHRPLARLFCYHIPSEGDYDFKLAQSFIQDKEFTELCREYLNESRKSHGFFVAQPFVKYNVDEISSPELRFQEASALVRSVPNWKVVDGGLFPVSSAAVQAPLFFNQNVINKLSQIVTSNPLITSIFIGVDKLLGRQQYEMEKLLPVPIYDRFSVIMEIFRFHARSGEAMLQVQLAEIPYLFSRIQQYHNNSHKKPSYGVGYRGAGQSVDPVKRYKRFLDSRAKLIKKALLKVEIRRSQAVERRKKFGIPTIAVIGYTNCGKTSLIKTLTKLEKLQPEDRLFATMDITAHHLTLPSFKDALLLDSIGFISNIPKELMDSFNVTFKDVGQSDLLLHVYDIGHPDLKNQIQTVYSTLKQLRISEKLTSSMINIANKIDLASQDAVQYLDNESKDHLKCSATEKTNIEALVKEIDHGLIKATKRNLLKLRVPSGGQEVMWLQRESKIISLKVDELDENFLLVETSISPASYSKFNHYFGANSTE